QTAANGDAYANLYKHAHANLDKNATGDEYSDDLSAPFGYLDMDTDGFAYADRDLDFYSNNDE
ncbi:MAG: hypothetical protein RBU29_00730, partial [bacterium]|nr:hypothetical protein [bacterium]